MKTETAPTWFQAEWIRARDGATVYGEIHERGDEARMEIPSGRPFKLSMVPRAKGDRKADFIRQGLLHAPTPRAERR